MNVPFEHIPSSCFTFENTPPSCFTRARIGALRCSSASLGLVIRYERMAERTIVSVLEPGCPITVSSTSAVLRGILSVVFLHDTRSAVTVRDRVIETNAFSAASQILSLGRKTVTAASMFLVSHLSNCNGPLVNRRIPASRGSECKWKPLDAS